MLLLCQPTQLDKQLSDMLQNQKNITRDLREDQFLFEPINIVIVIVHV